MPGPYPKAYRKPIEGYFGWWQPPHENDENLKEGYYEDLMRDYGNNKEWINMYILGQPGVRVRGKPVYANYQATKHSSRELIEWNGTPLWISRSGYTGEDGFEITVPAEAATALADALIAEAEVKPIGLGARDSLRLEAGLPLYGHDLDPETTPVMADLGFALSKRRREEGNFMGAGRILLEREQGPVVKRVGLVVEGRQPVREGAAVVDTDGSDVGKVTSGGFAPSFGAPIAMAYVPAAMAVAGTVIQISQRGKVHQATVTAMPLIPHRYVRTGGK